MNHVIWQEAVRKSRVCKNQINLIKRRSNCIKLFILIVFLEIRKHSKKQNSSTKNIYSKYQKHSYRIHNNNSNFFPISSQTS